MNVQEHISHTKGLDLPRVRNTDADSLHYHQVNRTVLSRLDLSDLKMPRRMETFIRALVPANFVINKAYRIAFHKEPRAASIQKIQRKPVFQAGLLRLEKLLRDVQNEYGSYIFAESVEKAQTYLVECDRELVRLNKLLEPLVEKIEKHQDFKGSLRAEYDKIVSALSVFDGKVKSGELLEIEERKEYDKLNADLAKVAESMKSTSILTEDEAKQYSDWSYQRRKWLTVAGAWKENLDKVLGFLSSTAELRVDVQIKELNGMDDAELARIAGVESKELPSGLAQVVTETPKAEGEG